MLKKILLFLAITTGVIILLSLNWVIYLHFQKVTDADKRQLNYLASELKIKSAALAKDQAAIAENQAAIQKQAVIQLRAQGVYMSGDCVPAPDCPASYRPEIYAIPISTLDVNAKTKGSRFSPNFSALAVGKLGDVISSPTFPNEVSDCTKAKVEPCVNRFDSEMDNTNKKFWRVCLFLSQENPSKQKARDNAYSTGIMAVFTQCRFVPAPPKNLSTPPENVDISPFPPVH